MLKRGWWYLITSLVITGVPVVTSMVEPAGGAAAAVTAVTINANNPSFYRHRDRPDPQPVVFHHGNRHGQMD